MLEPEYSICRGFKGVFVLSPPLREGVLTGLRQAESGGVEWSPAVWWDELSEEEQDAIAARVAQLEERGPSLKRPAVGAIKESQHDGIARSVRSPQIRVLFIFDPRSKAISVGRR
jgi:hypothetical protein